MLASQSETGINGPRMAELATLTELLFKCLLVNVSTPSNTSIINQLTRGELCWARFVFDSAYFSTGCASATTKLIAAVLSRVQCGRFYITVVFRCLSRTGVTAGRVGQGRDGWEGRSWWVHRGKEASHSNDVHPSGLARHSIWPGKSRGSMPTDSDEAASWWNDRWFLGLGS